MTRVERDHRSGSKPNTKGEAARRAEADAVEPFGTLSRSSYRSNGSYPSRSDLKNRSPGPQAWASPFARTLKGGPAPARVKRILST